MASTHVSPFAGYVWRVARARMPKGWHRDLELVNAGLTGSTSNRTASSSRPFAWG